MPPPPPSATSNPPPNSSLNVIALVSGGKDSLYSILHCIRNGHTVVALANLYPDTATIGKEDEDDEGDEDINSFMYQTIGHSVIPLYQEALGIPLYRAPITGDAVDTSRVYASTHRDHSAQEQSQSGAKEDETESLLPLLSHVKQAHPSANAVSAGAILSTYQRTRIENVAGRLSLTPLAWLWMYPVLPAPVERQGVAGVVSDAGLLEDMAACGCEARIIKVASGGLDGGFLWGDVSSSPSSGSGSASGLRGRLVKAMRRFAAEEDIHGAVLGEGGEYESLALDGPDFLWKGRIEIEGREERSGEGGVGYMRLRGARCVIKERGDGIGPGVVRRPALLDEGFAEVMDGLDLDLDVGVSVSAELDMAMGSWRMPYEPAQTKDTNLWTISNLTGPEAGSDTSTQMTAIAQKTLTILSSPDTQNANTPTTNDIIFATVLLRTMTDYTPMNNIYNTLFQRPNPPARATIACGDILPEGVNVMVSFVVHLGASEVREGLHVQSRSYWAPANIGPYSQAISVPLEGGGGGGAAAGGRLVYVAGQIPLEPASMEIVTSSSVESAPGDEQWVKEFALRVVLAVQHMWRIAAAMQVDWWVGAVAYLTGEVGGGEVEMKARMAWQLWERMHTQPNDEEDDDEDEEPALDAWDIKYGGRAHEQMTGSRGPSLPNFAFLQRQSDDDTSIPPFFAVQVAELPRGSDIEWQGLGSQCPQVSITRQTDTTIKTTANNLTYTTIEIGTEQAASNLEVCLREILEIHGGSGCHVLYTARPLAKGFVWPGLVVACLGVWGREGARLDAGVVVQRGC